MWRNVEGNALVIQHHLIGVKVFRKGYFTGKLYVSLANISIICCLLKSVHSLGAVSHTHRFVLVFSDSIYAEYSQMSLYFSSELKSITFAQLHRASGSFVSWFQTLAVISSRNWSNRSTELNESNIHLLKAE